ncbi:hypothetical protein G7K_5736-t1 [Saitoella complicata NRRL Y-17804]|uniref:Uncharacterized protein n=1 Tax=Saitoella complicata (strain BCRC 22490 / CBS 7301 / JCM 7358 / NBRC 10748 / NRRL Y-17804) TaxID=698492 RepID=A0A0E9NPN3_SAICN|nr:hypothetical protein G7K_5736-t1 [Saitoella complicata NRRL Y-17804]
MPKRTGHARKTPARLQDVELEPDIHVIDLTHLPDDATTEMIKTAALPLLSRTFRVRLVVSRPGRSAYPELLTEMKPQWDWNTFSTEVSEDDCTLKIAYRVVKGNFRPGPTSITGIEE